MLISSSNKIVAKGDVVKVLCEGLRVSEKLADRIDHVTQYQLVDEKLRLRREGLDQDTWAHWPG